MPWRHFFGTRVTIRKADTNEESYGWLSPESDGIIVIESEDPSFDYGDKVILTMDNAKISTMVESVFMSYENGFSCFAMPPALSIRQGASQGRLRGRLFVIDITFGEESHSVVVEDIGQNGLSIRTNLRFAVGTALSFSVPISKFDAAFEGKVAYCNELGEGKVRYGITVDNMDRISRVKWTRILNGEHLQQSTPRHLRSAG